jgi:protein involved in polysaccharide export with SLBB domain
MSNRGTDRPAMRPLRWSLGARAALALWAVLSSLVSGGATCGVADSTTLPPVRASVQNVLGPGDLVEIRVFGEPELSATHEVSASGTIRLALIGSVPAAGLTPDALTLNVEQLYNEKYLRDAKVSILVKEQRSRKVYVLGQVSKPGPVIVDGRITVIEAIARAGGTTQLADANRTLLTREGDDGQVRVLVPVGEIGIGRSPDIELQPGDILFVPESPF